MSRFTFQWHITDTCNLRCKHCYQNNYTEKGLPLEQLLAIGHQLHDFVKKNNIKNAHINFTGGEPFLRTDIAELLIEINKYKTFSFGILSNGYIPSNSTLDRLKPTPLKFIQISLEGKEKTNDRIRGKGSYQQVKQALKTYGKYKIPTMLSFTANTENYKEFHHVVKTARKYKAFKVWTDRYLPLGNSDTLQLSTQQFKELGGILVKERKKIRNKNIEVAANRALQFLFAGGTPYQCSAGKNLLAILANGDLLPCRRLDIKVGNLLTDDLNELYFSSELLKDIRDKNKLDQACLECYYKLACMGGLKCLSYAQTNNYHKKDTNCWI